MQRTLSPKRKATEGTGKHERKARREGGKQEAQRRGSEWKEKMGAPQHGVSRASLSKGSASQNSGKSEIG